ncbi:MAG: hypothetical protein AAFW46_11805 [Pseudomonadota bacterium]
MALTLAAGPATPPVAIADLAEHARLAHLIGADAEDQGALTRCLDAASAAVERACGTALIRQTWDWRIVSWRDGGAEPLPLAPVLSIEEVALVSAAGVETALDPAHWRLDRAGPRETLRAAAGALPPIPAGGAARIRFQAGYGDAPDDVPADLRHAVRLLASHYFERRHAADEDALAPIPSGVAALIEPHRPIRL